MDKFNFNRDFYEGCRALGDREGMALAWAMLRYGYEGIEPKLKPTTMAAFSFARGRIDAMVSGSIGGRARAAKSSGRVPCQGGSQGATQQGSQQKEKEKEKEKAEPDSWDYTGSRPVNVDAGRIDSVKVEDVELEEPPKDGGMEKTGDITEREETGDSGETERPEKTAEAKGAVADKKLNHLTGKVAQYYGLEESDIEIQWKND